MQANHDPGTGLPNRRFFAEWLSYAIAHARRERGHVGVLFIATTLFLPKGIAGLLTGLWAKRRVVAPVAPVPAGEGAKL